MAAAISNAVAKGYGESELEKACLSPAIYQQAASGGDITLAAATEVARACGYRLRLTLESLDNERVVTPLGEVDTAFEATFKLMAEQHMLKDIAPDQLEELLRRMMACYFGKIRDKGYYLTKGS